jgi:pimeloyl-ACP methyl ester carboxylesterase
MRKSRSRFAQVNGARIFVELFGENNLPLILLLAGATNSLDWWDADFCQLLADEGYRVARFDYRDTGRSTTYPANEPDYGFDELVTDCVALIDYFGATRAHLVGCSMGAGIAQRMAIEHQERVASIALFSTTPGMRPGAPSTSGLPPPSRSVRVGLAMDTKVDWSSRTAAINEVVRIARLFAGPKTAGTGYFERLAARVFDRTTNMAASMSNHWRMQSGHDYHASLGDIRVPTLIAHGTQDPLFAFEHAEQLARAIGHARLLPLVGVGHEIPPEETWSLVVPQLIALAAE